ncbi:MAG: L,D-transpeptidase [Actinobacteria bacterium]|nr:L,D-transpeptidase [Actinomycetota bacterium]
MREVVTGRANRGAWVAALLTAAVIVLALAAPALASSSAAPESASSAAPEPVPTTLTAALSAASVAFGGEVTVTGALVPAAEGEEVVITLSGAEMGRAVTDASGAFELAFTPRRSGDVAAVLAADPGVVSPAQKLAVKPKASVSHGALVPFLKSTFVVRIAPSAYDGVVVLKIVHRKVVVGTYKARARDGRAVFRVPLRGVDGFTLTFVLPADGGLSGRSLQTKVAVRAKTLSVGAKGPYVKGMLTGLQRLRFRIPGMGSTFTTRVKDSVMAFQKAYRLKRTYVFNTECWRKLDGAKLIKARRATPATHIEVDKTRQILMIVKGGKPWGIIAVSTGATGNTPEGTFRIQQKHPYTSSGFGGTLVRTMGFKGDFAIHGWSSVPPYPASHGCVREPIWACYWTYDNSWVGETVYVYR